MRRSTTVIAPLLASAAVALLASCNSSEPQRCVDENNHVVDPSFCKNLPGNGQPVAGVVGNHGGYYNNGIFIPHYYRYYYGGSYSSGGGGFGSVVSGGSYEPVSGHSYSVGGTSRGGFGSSFGGSGEGGGGE